MGAPVHVRYIYLYIYILYLVSVHGWIGSMLCNEATQIRSIFVSIWSHSWHSVAIALVWTLMTIGGNECTPGLTICKLPPLIQCARIDPERNNFCEFNRVSKYLAIFFIWFPYDSVAHSFEGTKCYKMACSFAFHLYVVGVTMISAELEKFSSKTLQNLSISIAEFYLFAFDLSIVL